VRRGGGSRREGGGGEYKKMGEGVKYNFGVMKICFILVEEYILLNK